MIPYLGIFTGNVFFGSVDSFQNLRTVSCCIILPTSLTYPNTTSLFLWRNLHVVRKFKVDYKLYRAGYSLFSRAIFIAEMSSIG
jgi:hypothetical protein